MVRVFILWKIKQWERWRKKEEEEEDSKGGKSLKEMSVSVKERKFERERGWSFVWKCENKWEMLKKK